MSTTFQLYQEAMEGYAPSSTIFDMISSSSNDLEPKQTKALAYMLASENKLLDSFLKKLLGFQAPELRELTFEIMAESYVKSHDSNRNKRADIIIRSRDKLNRIRWAVIIEAKSMNIDITAPDQLTRQISYYCEQLGKKWRCEIMPVVLTKNIDKTLGGKIRTVCWSQVIELVENLKIDSRIYADFKDFMIGANRKMHFYEKEVLAIACGKTYNHVMANRVYVCPNKRSYHHKKSLYMAFIQDGGKITELLKPKARYILPIDVQEIQRIAIPKDDKDIIVEYFNNVRKGNTATFHTSMKEYSNGAVVYVLSTEDTIVLPSAAKAQKPIQNKAYFKLADMLDPKKCSALIPAK